MRLYLSHQPLRLHQCQFEIWGRKWLILFDDNDDGNVMGKLASISLSLFFTYLPNITCQMRDEHKRKIYLQERKKYTGRINKEWWKNFFVCMCVRKGKSVYKREFILLSASSLYLNSTCLQTNDNNNCKIRSSRTTAVVLRSCNSTLWNFRLLAYFQTSLSFFVYPITRKVKKSAFRIWK